MCAAHHYASPVQVRPVVLHPTGSRIQQPLTVGSPFVDARVVYNPRCGSAPRNSSQSQKQARMAADSQSKDAPGQSLPALRATAQTGAALCKCVWAFPGAVRGAATLE